MSVGTWRHARKGGVTRLNETVVDSHGASCGSGSIRECLMREGGRGKRQGAESEWGRVRSPLKLPKGETAGDVVVSAGVSPVTLIPRGSFSPGVVAV